MAADAPTPTRPGDFKIYLEVQAHNLSEIRQLAEFNLVERVMRLYDQASALRPRDPDIRFLQLFIVCHGGLLSAAATIGRALPLDTIAITRRAIEAGSLAAAIKADPGNYHRWLDATKRLQRWEERHQGRRPKGQAGQGIVYPAAADKLRSHLGTLSDSGVHLTPEFISMQRVRLEPIEGTKGSFIRISYFENDQREIERALMVLSTIHREILELFNHVFDGAFHRDAEWVRQREEVLKLMAELAQRFRSVADSKEDQ